MLVESWGEFLLEANSAVFGLAIIEKGFEGVERILGEIDILIQIH